MDKKRLLPLCAVLAVCAALPATTLTAGTWDSLTKRMNPAKGEAVAYDRSDCTAPDAVGAGVGGYYGFVDKTGVSYPSVGGFNDLASCILVGPQTRVRIYKDAKFKGSSIDIQNTEVDEVLKKDLSDPLVNFNNKMSSIKVWTM